MSDPLYVVVMQGRTTELNTVSAVLYAGENFVDALATLRTIDEVRYQQHPIGWLFSIKPGKAYNFFDLDYQRNTYNPGPRYAPASVNDEGLIVLMVGQKEMWFPHVNTNFSSEYEEKIPPPEEYQLKVKVADVT